MNRKEINRLLAFAIKASVFAGKEILDVYHSEDFGVQHKADKSPLTLADRKAHHTIINYLAETNLPVLSEEGRNIPYQERKNWDYFWLVDPLDGTKEFIKRNGEFTVNIALIEKGFPLGGVVFVPVTGELYFAAPDGAFKINQITPDMINSVGTDLQELEKSAIKLPSLKNKRKFTVVGSRSHFSEETEIFIEQIRKEKGEIEFITKGSSLKLCMVAEGKADIYPRFAPTMEWDTAAGHAIVGGSGGIVTKQDGKTFLKYNKKDLLNPWFIARR